LKKARHINLILFPCPEGNIVHSDSKKKNEIAMVKTSFSKPNHHRKVASFNTKKRKNKK